MTTPLITCSLVILPLMMSFSGKSLVAAISYSLTFPLTTVDDTPIGGYTPLDYASLDYAFFDYGPLSGTYYMTLLLMTLPTLPSIDTTPLGDSFLMTVSWTAFPLMTALCRWHSRRQSPR